MTHFAVIGCGFGDEGKGRATDFLCSRYNISLVVRYSGGQQAGHQVIQKGLRRHVFSNFGSGTFQGIPTYWSKHCTIDPIGIMNELDVLINKMTSPVLYIDERCPVTTPYDKAQNKQLEEKNDHGSCGLGIGTTHQREQDRYSLLFGDLFSSTIFKIKLDLIKQYYSSIDINVRPFLHACFELINSGHIKITQGFPIDGPYLFEGSQGLLLDQDIGFFPHVSRTNTGSKNILNMGIEPDIVLVTRAYQTRHGNGPMTNEFIPHNIKLNPYEKNPSDNCQGEFRRALLDLDLLKYAINKDDYIRRAKSKSLVITCLDLIKNEYRFTANGEIKIFLDEYEFVNAIKDFLDIHDIYLSKAPAEGID